MIRLIFISFLFSSLTIGCAKKPTACLEIEDAVEAGTLIEIESCSENYEFLTWEFSDGVARVTDIPERQFNEEGEYSVTVTAYAPGGYRSDSEATLFKASYRYVDYVEVVGESVFKRFEFDFFENFRIGNALDTFTVESPLVKEFYPDEDIIILPQIQDVVISGVKPNNATSELVTETINFGFVKDNPYVFETEKFSFKIYWTYYE